MVRVEGVLVVVGVWVVDGTEAVETIESVLPGLSKKLLKKLTTGFWRSHNADARGISVGCNAMLLVGVPEPDGNGLEGCSSFGLYESKARIRAWRGRW